MEKKRLLLILAILILVSTTYVTLSEKENFFEKLSGFLTSPLIQSENYEKGVIYVKFKQTYDVKEQQQAFSLVNEIKSSNNKLANILEVKKLFNTKKNYEQKKEFGLDRWVELKIPNGTNVKKEAEKWSKLKEVEVAEPLIKSKPLSPPNDPKFQYQWHHNNRGDNIPGISSLVEADIDSVDAWDSQTGNVIVTNLESVEWYHEDLIENIWQNIAEDDDGDEKTIEWSEELQRYILDPDDINGIDDDANGYIDDLIGWDFFQQDNDPSPADPSNYHGTSTAGVMMAKGNNNKGISGVCQNCKLIVIKSMSNPAGIVYAADNGAKVITISFTGYGISMRSALEYANSIGTVTFSAMGNDGMERAIGACYPKSTICVAGSDYNNNYWPISNYGEKADLSSPADHIYTIDTSDDYKWTWGTSLSSPIAAGVAALVLSEDSDLSPKEVRSILQTSAIPFSQFTPNEVYAGRGIINAFRAVDLAKNSGGSFPIATIEDQDIPIYIENQMLGIYGTASGDNFASYIIKYGKGLYGKPTNSTNLIMDRVNDGLLHSLDLAYLEEDEYHIYLEVVDTNKQMAIDDYYLKRNENYYCKGWLYKNTCSEIRQPFFCDSNTMESIENCQTCGCPTGKFCYDNGSCQKVIQNDINFEVVKSKEQTPSSSEPGQTLQKITGKYSKNIFPWQKILEFFSKRKSL